MTVPACLCSRMTPLRPYWQMTTNTTDQNIHLFKETDQVHCTTHVYSRKGLCFKCLSVFCLSWLRFYVVWKQNIKIKRYFETHQDFLKKCVHEKLSFGIFMSSWKLKFLWVLGCKLCVRDKRVRNKASYLIRLFIWTSSRNLLWLHKNSLFRKWVIFPSWSGKGMKKLLNVWANW